MTKRKFCCVAYIMRMLNSCVIYKFLTVNPGCPPFPPYTFSAQLLFDATFAQPCIFAVANFADVALSVFYSPVLTRCRLFLQL